MFILKKYVDEVDPWCSTLAMAAFANRSTQKRFKYYSPGQLLSGRNIILPIKHTVD